MTAPKQKLHSPESRALPLIRDWQAIAALCIAVGIFFRDIILQRAYFWEDFLYYFYPVRNFAAVSLAGGEMPLWNPYTLNGMPFQADIQSGIFYLPNLLLTFFVRGERLNFYWLELEIILHFMVAGVCMYYLAKHFGCTPLVALFSGLVYALSGFMIVHAIHQVVICQVAWFPLVILLFHKSVQEKSIPATILGGIVLGHAFLAGYPQMSLYIYFFLFVFFLFLFVYRAREAGWKSAGGMIPLAVGFIVIAVAVTAIQLLPTIELAPQSQRAEITYEKSQEGVLPLAQLVTAVAPKFFGSSSAQHNSYWGAGTYWVFWETCLYAGISALLLMIVAFFLIRKNPTIGFFAGIVLFSLLFAIGDQFIVHKIFFYVVPGFDKFRNPGRIAILFTLSAALLSGFGLQYLLDEGKQRSKRITVILVGLLAAVALLTFAVYDGFLQPASNATYFQQVHAIATGEMKTAMILSLLAIVSMYLLATRKIPVFLGIGAICVLQFVDVHMFGFEQNNHTMNPEEYYNRPAELVKMLKADRESEITRINSRQGGAMILDRNQGMVDRIFMMEGYTPLALQRYIPPAKNWESVCDLMNAKFRIRIDAGRSAMDLETATTHLPRAHFLYDEHVISDEGSLRAFMIGKSFNPMTMLALEEPGGLSLHDTTNTLRGTATIASYSLGAITIDASTPSDGYLLLSEIYYPGWKAYVDGIETKILRADWSLRAIPVKAGSHRVEFRFEPDSFRRGMWVTLLTLALCSAGMVYSTKRKKAQSG